MGTQNHYHGTRTILPQLIQAVINNETNFTTAKKVESSGECEYNRLPEGEVKALEEAGLQYTVLVFPCYNKSGIPYSSASSICVHLHLKYFGSIALLIFFQWLLFHYFVSSGEDICTTPQDC